MWRVQDNAAKWMDRSSGTVVVDCEDGDGHYRIFRASWFATDHLGFNGPQIDALIEVDAHPSQHCSEPDCDLAVIAIRVDGGPIYLPQTDPHREPFLQTLCAALLVDGLEGTAFEDLVTGAHLRARPFYAVA